jgi:hypothetical protein
MYIRNFQEEIKHNEEDQSESYKMVSARLEEYKVVLYIENNEIKFARKCKKSIGTPWKTVNNYHVKAFDPYFCSFF